MYFGKSHRSTTVETRDEYVDKYQNFRKTRTHSEPDTLYEIDEKTRIEVYQTEAYDTSNPRVEDVLAAVTTILIVGKADNGQSYIIATFENASRVFQTEIDLDNPPRDWSNYFANLKLSSSYRHDGMYREFEFSLDVSAQTKALFLGTEGIYMSIFRVNDRNFAYCKQEIVEITLANNFDNLEISKAVSDFSKNVLVENLKYLDIRVSTPETASWTCNPDVQITVLRTNIPADMYKKLTCIEAFDGMKSGIEYMRAIPDHRRAPQCTAIRRKFLVVTIVLYEINQRFTTFSIAIYPKNHIKYVLPLTLRSTPFTNSPLGVSQSINNAYYHSTRINRKKREILVLYNDGKSFLTANYMDLMKKLISNVSVSHQTRSIHIDPAFFNSCNFSIVSIPEETVGPDINIAYNILARFIMMIGTSLAISWYPYRNCTEHERRHVCYNFYIEAFAELSNRIDLIKYILVCGRNLDDFARLMGTFDEQALRNHEGFLRKNKEHGVLVLNMILNLQPVLFTKFWSRAQYLVRARRADE